MVGQEIQNQLQQNAEVDIITRNRSELNLVDQRQVISFFKNEHIDQVYLAAAKVGGIFANNNYPADFLYENLMIEANIIHSAHCADVNKLLFLGSSCIYPKFSPQPITEDALMKGQLEPTNESYAVAKIAGIKLCESYNRQYNRDYRSVMPTNLYGPHDNFDEKNSHVIPGLLNRFHDAIVGNRQEVTIWGSGNPKRDFLHVKDMANACIFVMNQTELEYSTQVHPMNSHINIGSGAEFSIKTLVEIIASITGFSGSLRFDTSKPDGTMRKLLDTSILQRLGWWPKIDLKTGLISTYDWYVANNKKFRE